jgi:hypothetical protein
MNFGTRSANDGCRADGDRDRDRGLSDPTLTSERVLVVLLWLR